MPQPHHPDEVKFYGISPPPTISLSRTEVGKVVFSRAIEIRGLIRPYRFLMLPPVKQLHLAALAAGLPMLTQAACLEKQSAGTSAGKASPSSSLPPPSTSNRGMPSTTSTS